MEQLVAERCRCDLSPSVSRPLSSYLLELVAGSLSLNLAKSRDTVPSISRFMYAYYTYKIDIFKFNIRNVMRVIVPL